jgi:hypothetical protein
MKVSFPLLTLILNVFGVGIHLRGGFVARDCSKLFFQAARQVLASASADTINRDGDFFVMNFYLDVCHLALRINGDAALLIYRHINGESVLPELIHGDLRGILVTELDGFLSDFVYKSVASSP